MNERAFEKRKRCKLTSLLACGFVIAAVTAAQPLPAEEWRTVLSVRAEGSAQIGGMAADAAGNLYAALSRRSPDDRSRRQAKILKSSDRGTTWTAIDTLYSNPYEHIDFACLAIDQQNRIYAVGSQEDRGQVRWMVRRGEPGRTNFVTVDDLAWRNGQKTIANATCVDGDGTVYVAGSARDDSESDDPSVWLVRESRDTGQTWENIDIFSHLRTSKAVAIVAARGAVYVAGTGSDNVFGSTGYWVVRKGVRNATGKFDWKTIDNLSLEEGDAASTCSPRGICVDQHSLYVVGETWQESTTYAGTYWTVRRMPLSGGSWEVVDEFQLTRSQNSAACKAIARLDGIFVLGWGQTRDLTPVWVLRHSLNGSKGAWTTMTGLEFKVPLQSPGGRNNREGIDTWAPPSQIAIAQGLASGADSSLFCAGYAACGDSISLIVRKLETRPAIAQAARNPAPARAETRPMSPGFNQPISRSRELGPVLLR